MTIVRELASVPAATIISLRLVRHPPSLKIADGEELHNLCSSSALTTSFLLTICPLKDASQREVIDFESHFLCQGIGYPNL